jgi:hypothetical protein
VSIFRVLNNLFQLNRTNWKALSLCFVAATVFWLFNALNKNYSSNIRFPLKFEFDHQKFAPARALPHDVYINVSGKGWDLLRRNLGFRLPVVTIPLDHPSETKKIVAGSLPPLVASQLGNLKIIHIVTDTLFLSIEPTDSVRIKVVADLSEVKYNDEYGRVSPVVILPDSVQLTGPRSLIAAMADSIILRIGPQKLTSNFREQFEISESELIRRNPPVVEIIFEVGEVTTIRTSIKLELVNIPNASRVNLGSDSIMASLQVPRTRMADFSEASGRIRAILDLQDSRSGAKKLLPTLTGVPTYAKIIKMDSVRLRMY